MAEESDPGVSTIELQEEFIQHMERGGRKVRLLAAVATVSGAYFAITYFLQLVVFPYVLGDRVQVVNLVDPGLMVAEAVSLAIALLWTYAGVRDLLFSSRMGRRIREIRDAQSKTAKDYGLTPRVSDRET
jgi:hypothetical protein